MGKRLFLLAILGLLAGACKQGGSLSLDSLSPDTVPNIATGAEFVSSSTSGASTASGYIVQQSVGGPTPTVVTTSTSGYKLYSSVQGEIFSLESSQSLH